MAKEKLKWTNVNVATMPAKLKKMYAEYRRAQDEATDLRDSFNAEFLKSLDGKVESPDDMENPRLVISHGFGRLGFAWTNAPARGSSEEFSF